MYFMFYNCCMVIAYYLNNSVYIAGLNKLCYSLQYHMKRR